jgi:nucleoside-diphosphate-sugar epimerase
VPDPAGRSPLRVAVTGARGFIGSHLVSALAARGDTPVAIARPFTEPTLSAEFRAVDAVVHLAGVVAAVRRRDYFEANVDAAAVIARAASAAGAPMVHISSLAAAGPAPLSAPRSEDDEPAPITAYGESKLAGERVVQATPALRWLVLRPGVVYGPGDRALLPLLRYARLGVLPLVGNERSAYMFIYIDDAIRAILAAIDVVRRDPSARATVFIGHREPVGNRMLLDAVRAVARPSARLVPVPKVMTRLAAAFGDLGGAITRRPATINSRRFVELYSPGFVCRVDRMRDWLGVEAAVGLDEGLRRAARWYREHGWLDAQS